MTADLIGQFATVVGLMGLIGSAPFVAVLGIGAMLRWW